MDGHGAAVLSSQAHRRPVKGRKWMEALGAHCLGFPTCPLFPQSFPETGWGGSEREGSSCNGAMVSVSWLGLHGRKGLRVTRPFLPLLEMGPQRVTTSPSVGRAGGSMHCRFCIACRFHQLGLLTTPQSSDYYILSPRLCCASMPIQMMKYPVKFQESEGGNSILARGQWGALRQRALCRALQATQEGGGGHP